MATPNEDEEENRHYYTSRGRTVISVPPSFPKEHDQHQIRPPELHSNEVVEVENETDLSSDFASMNNWARSDQIGHTVTEPRHQSDQIAQPIDDTLTEPGVLVRDSSPHLDDMLGNPSAYAPSQRSIDEQQVYSRPRNYIVPDMSSYWKRLETFLYWPLPSPTPQVLASVNMFYEGSFYHNGEPITDQVRCFKCGQTFRGWEPNDDPEEEHKRLSMQCFDTHWLAEL